MIYLLRLSLLIATTTLLSNASGDVIDTRGTWDGDAGISSFGAGATETFGQSFTVGSDTNLSNFTFWLNDKDNSPAVSFRGYIQQFDIGTRRATGAILFESNTHSTVGDADEDVMESFAFATGGITLTTGETYIAFISSLAVTATNTERAKVGSAPGGSTYSGGDFYFNNAATTLSQLTSEDWGINDGNDDGNRNDLAFIANFDSAAVPEPQMFPVLLVTAMMLLVYSMRTHSEHCHT